MSTLAHEWRSDEYLEVEVESRTLEIGVSLEKLLGMEIDDFREFSHLVKLEPYRTTSLQAVKTAIAQYQEVNTRDWIIRAMLIVGGVALVALIVIVCCVCSQTKAIRALRQLTTAEGIRNVITGSGYHEAGKPHFGLPHLRCRF